MEIHDWVLVGVAFIGHAAFFGKMVFDNRMNIRVLEAELVAAKKEIDNLRESNHTHRTHIARHQLEIESLREADRDNFKRGQ